MADSPASAGSLIELCTGLVKALADLPEKSGAASADDLRARFNDLFIDVENRAQRLGKNPDDVRLAKYAFAALIDETILLSELPAKEEWLQRPLQMQYFDDFSAGEEFYNKLDTLRVAKNPGAVEVLEVYFHCLALGFKGKLGDRKGQERRRVLMDNLAIDISQLRGTPPRSPLAVQPEAAAGRPATAGKPFILLRGPAWLLPLACAAVVLVVWLACGLIGRSQLADLATTVQAEKSKQSVKPGAKQASEKSP